MKAITLYQPWASLMAIGHKRFETRSWKANYRGPILVHAGQGYDGRAMIGANDYLAENGHPPLPNPFPLGAVVAVGRLIDVRAADPDAASEMELRFGDWRPARFAWEMELTALPSPIPWRGRQGLWSAPPGLVEAVYEVSR